MLILLLVAGVVSVLAHLCLIRNRSNLELHCLACDARLDEIPLDAGKCPACLVKLVE